MHPSNPAGRPRFFAWSVVATLAILTLSACAKDSTTSPVQSDVTLVSPRLTQATGDNRKIPDQYIVVFDQSVGDVKGRANALLNAHGGNLHATYTSALRGFSAHMSAQAAAALNDEPGVAFVEQDQSVDVAGTQLNPSWGLDRIDQSTLPLDGQYNYPSGGTGVNVYIIDTGIRHTHNEFGGRVVQAYDGVNDGYGMDGCHWHGTHVAGLVGGASFGVAKSATLYSVRVFGCVTGGTPASQIIGGIDWVSANKSRPAVATLAIQSGYSDAINTAVQNSINSGITYVVAAGNLTSDACGMSPASVAGALTVASTVSNDAVASFSGFGPCVDLYGPGYNIYSAMNTADNATGLQSGTSMSAGFVAGAAALYLEAHPSASPAEVHQAIVSAATANVLSGVPANTPNRLLRVGGTGGTITPPPPPPPSGNAAPTANFTVSCSKANCTFDGSSSTDDAGVANYLWNFGDGTSSSGSAARTSHVYTTKGNYDVTVRLTVSDAAGLTSSMSKTVSIRNKGK